ncbi:MAG: hypothetical protein LAO20_18565 [Acidobacteriia bacterium]|nr:hypothetical protein [Terriglobia bacterium]
MFRLLLGLFRRSIRSRRDLLLENLALRQQLMALKRRNKRLRLSRVDRLFWVVAKRMWSKWKQALVIVTPKTVVRWHRAGFRLYWTWLSRHRTVIGRKPVSKDIRDVIFRMVAENPTWGAPRVHGELLKLGFAISERTVSRWVRRAPTNPEPAQHWNAFLQNHRETIAAMDFFTVPTLWVGSCRRDLLDHSSRLGLRTCCPDLESEIVDDDHSSLLSLLTALISGPEKDTPVLRVRVEQKQGSRILSCAIVWIGSAILDS